MKTIEQNKIIKFLKERPAIKISAIEKEAGIPFTNLASAIAGKRNIAKKHLPELIRVLKKYGFTFTD